MLPKSHILISLLVTFILVKIFHISFFYGVILLFSAILIDVDHYLLYVYQKNNLSLKKAYWYFYNRGIKFRKISRDKRKKYKEDILLFHNIEFLIIIFFLSWFYFPIFYILYGMILHMFIDIIDLIKKHIPLYTKTSIIYIYITNKNKKEFKTR
tara:strand:+ start:10260 stop:10721 length:462 start_codon:yes stop_codon:yes gene_type:complete